MKKLLGIVVLGLLLSSNAYAGYKVKLKDKNKYGTVFRISLPLLIDNVGKWDKAFQKTIDIANKHCKTFNKKTFTFWSERKGAYARDANGRLIPKYLADHDGWGIIQDLEPMFKVKVRYFCAENIDKAYETLKNYSKYFEYPFSSTIFSGTIKYSETSKDPFKFKNFVKVSEKPKKTEPKDEKPKKKKPKQTPDDEKVVAAASGSGFFVSNNGEIITNHHVIDQCKTVKVNFKGSAVEAKTLAIDKVNDIAILKANIKPDKVYSVSNEDVSLLEDVIVAGYPLGKKVSSAIKTHKGVVTSLAGAGDNYSNFQTDATINQGNSGGPIMNQKGNIVGIAVATWVEEGVQGVHFGIKSSTLKTFANANGLRFLPPNNRDLSNKQLGQLITSGTVYLECHMTIAKIKKMIAEANNRKAFFSEYR